MTTTATPGATRSGGIDVALWLALLAVTLPFHPRWLDFEQTRRGLGMLAAAVLAIDLARRGTGRWPAGAAWLAALVGWWCARTALGVVNVGAALERIGHGLALLVVFVWAAQRDVGRALAAVAALGATVAAWALGQQLGIAWPAGGELVATLANRNATGELQAVTLAAALALRPGSRRGAIAAVAVALAITSHLAVLGARGALLAALVAGGFASCADLGRAGAWWARAGRAAVLAGLAVALGLELVRIATPDHATPAPAAAVAGGAPAATPAAVATDAVASPRGDTLAVRFAIWDATLAMVDERPWIGHGPGQFRFEYPRFRTQRELELTTFGRRFPTAAMTPHQDPLEATIDGGLLGLAMLAGFAVIAFRSGRRVSAVALAVPLALGIAGLSRAPLANAPAALAAFAVLGSLGGAARSLHGAPRAIRAAWVLAALALGIGAARIAIGATAAAMGLQGLDGARLDTAIAWHPTEPRFHNLRIQAACGGVVGGALARVGVAELAAVEDHVKALLTLDPHNTNALVLAAQLLHGADQRDVAIAALRHALDLDPREPRATQLLAVIHAEVGDAAATLATLFADPHPLLRARLATDLELLAAAPRVAAHPATQRTLGDAAAFVATLDAVLADPVTPETNDRVRAFAARVGPGDDRARVLLARQFQALDRVDAANALAPDGLGLDAGTANLLAPVFAELDALPAWRALAR